MTAPSTPAWSAMPPMSVLRASLGTLSSAPLVSHALSTTVLNAPPSTTAPSATTAWLSLPRAPTATNATSRTVWGALLLISVRLASPAIRSQQVRLNA